MTAVAISSLITTMRIVAWMIHYGCYIPVQGLLRMESFVVLLDQGENLDVYARCLDIYVPYTDVYAYFCIPYQPQDI